MAVQPPARNIPKAAGFLGPAGGVSADSGAVAAVAPGDPFLPHASRTAEDAHRIAFRMSIALDSVTDGILMLGRDWCFTYLNHTAERLLLRTRVDLLGRNIWDEFPDATDLEFYRQYHRAVRDQVEVCFEDYYTPLKSWFEVRAFPSSEGLTIYFRDITARRGADRAIRDSEARFQMAAKATRDALWDWNIAEDRLWWSDGLQKLFGWSPEEMETGLAAWQSRLHPDDATHAYEDFSRAVEQGDETWEGHYRFRRKDGSYAYVHDRAFIQRDEHGAVTRAVGALSDITERMQTEQQLRQQALLLDTASDSIIVRDLDNRVLYWNKGAERLYGWKAEEMVGTERGKQRVEDLAAAGALEAVKRDGHWSGELTLPTRDGRKVIVRSRLTLGRDDAGQPSTVLSISTDITDIKQVETRLREQASLLDMATDAIVVRDLNYRLKYWNKGAEQLYGWKAEEVLGNADPLLLYRGGPTGRQIGRETLANGEWVGELHQVDRYGKDVVVQARLSLLRDEAGQPTGILCISTDLRERLDMEKRLRQSQKLEAVGQLTGGIAHDFNNLLTIIAGNADMLADALAERDDLRPLAEMTRTAAERGGALTKQLLAFARRQPLEAKTVAVAELVTGMDELLRRALGAHIELEVIKAPGLGHALIDPVQLESAILNLSINARDAMAEGGRLSIDIANVEMDEAYAEQNDVKAGGYVVVAVADTGAGIAPELLSRVFEPFFTTKEVGKGTGLGLSMVYGFAKQSGGHVKVYSELGHGTVVKLYLPRVAEQRDRDTATDATATAKGAEHVLLVEDDDLVRVYAENQLKLLDYRVTVARNGPEALELLRQEIAFDLMFTDMVMPGGLNGRQLADLARQIRPKLPVLFTSGYTEHASISQGRLEPGVHLLSKPYRRQDLAAKIRLVLDQQRDPTGNE